jgi:hypothetical protein
VSGLWMLSLACRHCHVCVGRVVISIFLIYACFTQLLVVLVHVSHCCLLPDLRACVHRQVVWFNCCRRCLPA